MKLYPNYVSPGGSCCTLPADYTALGAPSSEKARRTGVQLPPAPSQLPEGERRCVETGPLGCLAVDSCRNLPRLTQLGPPCRSYPM